MYICIERKREREREKERERESSGAHLRSHRYSEGVSSRVVNVYQEAPQESSLQFRKHLRSQQYILGVTSGVLNTIHESAQESSPKDIYICIYIYVYI